MKNYLINNGEGDLNQVIERESTRLHVNEFLNIDAILEGVLNKILLGNSKTLFFKRIFLFFSSNQSPTLSSDDFGNDKKRRIGQIIRKFGYRPLDEHIGIGISRRHANAGHRKYIKF